LFRELRERTALLTDEIRHAASALADLDAIAGFAHVSFERDFCVPEIVSLDADESRVLEIVDGRHPVVEQTLEIGESFVPNSFQLGVRSGKHVTCDLAILCGPNSAGKSCAIRTVGLIVILAQAGCLVPASRVRVGLVDRIFTRVGAVDDVSQGQSTFQVETSETAVILSQATSQSLVLLDEIGRGTAVADGIAIAWAVAEHMAGLEVGANAALRMHGRRPLVPRTIFVSHYHELNELAILPNVQSFQMQMIEDKALSEWICTHRIIPGACRESHGLAIARRAGFPPQVVARAEQVFDLLREPSKELARYLRASCNASANHASDSEGGFRMDSRNDSDDKESSSSDVYHAGYVAGRSAALRELGDLIAALQAEST
jgi:DNA mismatch repair protein MutS